MTATAVVVATITGSLGGLIGWKIGDRIRATRWWGGR